MIVACDYHFTVTSFPESNMNLRQSLSHTVVSCFRENVLIFKFSLICLQYSTEDKISWDLYDVSWIKFDEMITNIFFTYGETLFNFTYIWIAWLGLTQIPGKGFHIRWEMCLTFNYYVQLLKLYLYLVWKMYLFWALDKQTKAAVLISLYTVRFS